MKYKKLYIVTDWATYAVAEANDHFSALEKVYSAKRFRLIPPKELNDNTVTHAMCCEYTNGNIKRFERCSDETDIVLLMNELKETYHFQLSDDFYA